MDQGQIRNHQDYILKEVFSTKHIDHKCETYGIIKTIRNYTYEETKNAMDDLGPKLKKFSELIDLEHPDLHRIFNGCLVGENDGTFSKDACDLLKLLSYGQNWNLSKNIIKALKSSLKVHEYSTINEIEDPQIDKKHLRFISDCNLRNQLRSSRKNYLVPMTSIQRSQSKIWEQLPDDFIQYHRYNNKYQSDIDEAFKREKYFNNHGLTEMALSISKSISEKQLKLKNDQYYGFNKISLTHAAVILAKMSNFQIDMEASGYLVHSTIFATPDIFPNFSFYDDLPTFDRSYLSKKLEYYPRIYNLQELIDLASDEIKSMIDFLDAFPELGGKALFDSYRVLVPGINYPNHNQDAPYRFKSPDGIIQVFDSISSGQLTLDHTIVKQKSAIAIVLGELDGDFYFLGYFI